MAEAVDTSSSSRLDYQFAWRWLLPSASGDALAIYGLDEDATAWWRQCHKEPLTGKPADGVLLALDELTSDEICQSLTNQASRWLCAWGTGKAVRELVQRLDGYQSVRVYGLLPSATPRVVVPLSSSQAAVAGLRLHQPGRALARAVMWLADALARIGTYRLLQRSALVVACRDEDCPPSAASRPELIEVAGAPDYALYLGTPDTNRKTVALPVPVGPNHGIIKSAETPQACQSLRNEAKALSYFQETNLRNHVPEILALADEEGAVSLVQEYRQRCQVRKSRRHEAVIEFLGALAELHFSERTLRDVLDSMPESLVVEYVTLRQRLGELPPTTPLRFHRSHGDFAPWNCAWSDGGLFVYDWEASQAADLALADAFYYVLGPMLLVRQSVDGRGALRDSLAFAEQLIRETIMADIDCRLYLGLWLLRQSNPHTLYRNTAAALLDEWP